MGRTEFYRGRTRCAGVVSLLAGTAASRSLSSVIPQDSFSRFKAQGACRV